jgi:hypothetical protein
VHCAKLTGDVSETTINLRVLTKTELLAQSGGDSNAYLDLRGKIPRDRRTNSRQGEISVHLAGAQRGAAIS